MEIYIHIFSEFSKNLKYVVLIKGNIYTWGPNEIFVWLLFSTGLVKSRTV
jgi:hypothetical protein